VKNNLVFRQIHEIDSIATTHQIGEKRVFVTNDFCQSNLMQAAIGLLALDEIVENHLHPTMEEFFYFLEGEAIFSIDDKDYNCSKGTFIKIPINTMHQLKADSDIKFIYWGIAI